MNSTVRMSATEIYKDWHIIDAADQPLGRVASEVAKIIVGKHKPTYEPHLDDGDYVIVLNASKVRLSGRKRDQMVYYRHSGYPGGLKSRTFEQQMDRFPTTVLERAIYGMLPKGALGHTMRGHVKIYAGAEHPHHGQMAAMKNAEAERKAAAAEALDQRLASPKPPPRLRPLSVPQQVAGAVTAEPDPEVAAKPKRSAAKKKAETPVAAEAVTAEPVAEVTDVEAKPKPKAKRSPAKKKADAAVTAEAVVAEAATEAVEKPKAKRSPAKKKPAAKATAADGAKATTEDKPAPKPRKPRKKAATATVADESESTTETEE